MRIATTPPGKSTVLNSGTDNSVVSPATKTLRNLKKYHRRKAKPGPEKVKPRKAKLPDGKYFEKKERLSPKEKKEMHHEIKNIKKIRGARKKEAVRLYKIEFPNGELMACKDGPPYRSFIVSKDIEKLMHLNPRPARNYLTRVRKK